MSAPSWCHQVYHTISCQVSRIESCIKVVIDWPLLDTSAVINRLIGTTIFFPLRLLYCRDLYQNSVFQYLSFSLICLLDGTSQSQSPFDQGMSTLNSTEHLQSSCSCIYKSFNNQNICDAIIRAQDVMHSSPKLVVRVNKRKSSSMAYMEKSSKRGE